MPQEESDCYHPDQRCNYHHTFQPLTQMSFLLCFFLKVSNHIRNILNRTKGVLLIRRPASHTQSPHSLVLCRGNKWDQFFSRNGSTDKTTYVWIWSYSHTYTQWWPKDHLTQQKFRFSFIWHSLAFFLFQISIHGYGQLNNLLYFERTKEWLNKKNL